MTNKQITFLGATANYDIVAHRAEMQRKAEQGYLTGRGLWAGLKATWGQMDADDKAKELGSLA